VPFLHACRRSGLLGALALLTGACGSGEKLAQQAQVGDLLVRSGSERVHLERPFRPGVSNGLYGGVVRISGADGQDGVRRHELNAVCSLPGEPGWPAYDNLYGRSLPEAPLPGGTGKDGEAGQPGKADAKRSDDEGRWQILYHFDGRIERLGTPQRGSWQGRLKDNLCRRGPFDDSTARGSGSR
jgi:hypothetical protein